MSATAEVAPALTAAVGRAQDEGRGIARLDPAVAAELGLSTGDHALLMGPGGRAVVRVLPSFPSARGTRAVQLDAPTRRVLGVEPGAALSLSATSCPAAGEVVLDPSAGPPLSDAALHYLSQWIDGLPLLVGQSLTVKLDGRERQLSVRVLVPANPAVVVPDTALKVRPPPSPGKPRPPGYAAIGGLEREIESLRQIVELPLRHADLFEKLGIQAPRGVLLVGPPGTGKTLIARAVAGECEANFFSISAPEVMQKFYGESEAKLRELFDKAARQSPSIVFIDEIDAIAARRDTVQGEVEKRVVAQLLTLMDGLGERGQMVVIAATNLPHVLDPALRRPGRFDRELAIGMPGESARLDILKVHTRRSPLATDVDLQALARDARGYSGADLRALCQEAAVRVAARVAGARQRGEPATIEIAQGDFEAALAQIVPSSMRVDDVEVPDTRLEQVGGLAAAKQSLRECILWPLESPELYAYYGVRPSRGVLLHGPPGTGKTLLARAVATEARANFITVSGPALLSRYVGDSERAVRELFARARQASPTVIFFDEIDALAPVRGGGEGNAVSERVVAQLLTEIDGLSQRHRVWVLAATNRIDRLDPALLRPGRFDALVPIPLPQTAERAEILGLALARRPRADRNGLEALVERTEGWSGAELVALVDAAALGCIRAQQADPASEVRIDAAQLIAAMESVRPGGRRG